MAAPNYPKGFTRFRYGRGGYRLGGPGGMIPPRVESDSLGRQFGTAKLPPQPSPFHLIRYKGTGWRECDVGAGISRNGNRSNVVGVEYGELTQRLLQGRCRWLIPSPAAGAVRWRADRRSRVETRRLPAVFLRIVVRVEGKTALLGVGSVPRSVAKTSPSHWAFYSHSGNGSPHYCVLLPPTGREKVPGGSHKRR